MATIKNPSRRDIELPTRHVVPAQGTLETTNEVLRCADNAPMLAGLALSSQIDLTYDPEPDDSVDALAVTKGNTLPDAGDASVEVSDLASKKK
ncbi:MAG: hypothetical protein Q8K33_24200 [Cypionkella sp.]|uniref:hypothetical protein n=1 Tax=Cypionkella sp. TaxID=2811411 RepID=UPI002731D261|nr:hypothetical protein [Cypionkella sp.]MDP1620410.1 hypothetical protein [bacterium]MDP2051926.1 hypothetical protein [Cypionkella sp.]